MTTAEKYVTAAYLVVLAAVLLYVVLYAFKMSRLRREVEELSDLAAHRLERSEIEEPEPERASEHVR
jgi:hypothetical protein